MTAFTLDERCASIGEKHSLDFQSARSLVIEPPTQGDRPILKPITEPIRFRTLAPKQDRAKGMYALAPTTKPCPVCKSEMTVAMVTPLFFFGGNEVTYKCMECSVQIKRTFHHGLDLGPVSGTTGSQALQQQVWPVARGNAPDFVEVGEAGIAVDDAMRHQRCVQVVG